MAVSQLHISADGRDKLRAATSMHEILHDHLIKILYSICSGKERLLKCLGLSWQQKNESVKECSLILAEQMR